MQRKTVFLAYALILLLLLVGISFKFIEPVGAATTWTVDDDGPADFHTIQEAINAAADGDIIQVRAGIYYENIIVNKTLLLIGENRETTVVDGSGTDKAISVVSNNVNITQFTVRNTWSDLGQYGGIWILDSKGCNVICNFIADHCNGIRLDRSNSSIISGNMITQCDYGVALKHSHGNVVEDNMIVDSRVGIAVNFNYHPYVPALNVVKNNTVSSADFGISISFSDWNFIESNYIEKSDEGIGVTGDWNVVQSNIVDSNSVGIRLLGVRAMTRDPASVNNVTNNLLLENLIGVWLEVAESNVLKSNYLLRNNLGIRCQESNENVIYHNNFTDNITPAYLHESHNHIWDNGYPSGGNYWSDYAGVDSYGGPNQDEPGGDGIGDTPYVIDSSNQDNYPFMEPWSPQVELTVTSSPITEITFAINGTSQVTPFTGMLPEGSYTLEMPEKHGGFVWSHWLEDGDTSRIKTIILKADPTWTGVYVLAGPPSPPVGGIWVPINKSELLAPWIGLASLLTVATASIIYFRHRKTKQD